MVRPKKKSKRMEAKHKFKVKKKVAEHNRKLRKEARKSGISKKKKKDPGIPNLYPFKDQLLRQMEEKKLKDEEFKRKMKEKRLREVNKRRNLFNLQEDAIKRAKEFEKKKAMKENSKDVGFVMGARNETSLKAYYKEFKKVVEAADVILEVLDARDPMGCRCPQVEQSVLASGSSKKLVLVLNKIDLVPKEIAEKWLKYLRNEFPAVIFKSSTQTQKQHLSHSKVSINMANKDILSSSSCVGADTLLKLLGNYCRNKDIKTSITVGVVGFPNVGKSSIINSLKRSRACVVGNTPGVTKSMQEIQLDKHIKLLDSPGIVIDTGHSDAAVILKNCVKIENIDDPVPPVEAILRRCSKKQVMEKYCVPDYKDVNEFLTHLGKRLGKLKKGGVPDISAAGKMVLQDWNSGKIQFYTHPPEIHTMPTHISAEVVSEWSKEFDLTSLQKDEENELHGLGSPMEDAMILEPSKPTDSLQQDEEDSMESGEDEECPSDDDEESDEGESGEEMDESEEEQEDMTVVLSKPKTSSTDPVIKEKEKPVLSFTEQNEFNQQLNKNKKKEFKKQQKEKRKRENVKDSHMDDDEDNEMYSFDTDFV
ncbi:guanine nucleotide-binding protein-like 3 homolog [Exaiptasia diaphana]|uniref:CP-type G domain-containing protein n=1 Tax=Exaiptasia diaphana TaxID=2652724 RepID=A0A913YJL3_EXADI|nr:guanine nucleotide-binding protein-like 3 homolog [Exaiptasia diaphana]KXJ13499.1 Guanine nucleotide-binding protein-like 3-like [Exaiptasia diaphana]